MTVARVFKEAVFAGCIFEIVGIRDERVPTISRLSGRHPLLGVSVLVVLVVHFWKARRQYLGSIA